MSPTPPPKVLIVDESPSSRRMTRSLLIQAGFPVYQETSGGSEALRLLRSGGFGLVISARDMEFMTGLQLVREMRADAVLRSIPVLIVLSDMNTASVFEAKQAGASNYIARPFHSDELRKKVEATLAQG